MKLGASLIRSYGSKLGYCMKKLMANSRHPVFLESDTMSDTRHIDVDLEYVKATEHHGPYITTEYGNTVADLYIMSRPTIMVPSKPRPVPFLHEFADGNARRLVAAWNACANFTTEQLEESIVSSLEKKR